MRRIGKLSWIAVMLASLSLAQSVNLSLPAVDQSGKAVAIGTAFITWQPFLDNAAAMVLGGQKTVAIRGGILSTTLTASDKAGYVYNVLIMSGAAASSFEWRVPALGATSMAQLTKPVPEVASGTAATIAVGTTISGPPGSAASVTNSGTPSAAVLNFKIPAGAIGPAGPVGPTPAGMPNQVLATDASGSSMDTAALRRLRTEDMPASVPISTSASFTRLTVSLRPQPILTVGSSSAIYHIGATMYQDTSVRCKSYGNVTYSLSWTEPSGHTYTSAIAKLAFAATATRQVAVAPVEGWLQAGSTVTIATSYTAGKGCTGGGSTYAVKTWGWLIH